MQNEVGSELECIMEERRRKVEVWRARRNKAANAAVQAEKDEMEGVTSGSSLTVKVYFEL